MPDVTITRQLPVAAERLVLTMTDEPGTDPGEPLVVTFTANDGGSEFTLRQTGQWIDDAAAAALQAGYGAFFDVLERIATSSEA